MPRTTKDRKQSAHGASKPRGNPSTSAGVVAYMVADVGDLYAVYRIDWRRLRTEPGHRDWQATFATLQEADGLATTLTLTDPETEAGYRAAARNGMPNVDDFAPASGRKIDGYMMTKLVFGRREVSHE